jgi:hypothetical protein
MIINQPEIHAEVSAVFARYEAALVSNDVAVLDELFWDDPRTTRYGVGETSMALRKFAHFAIHALARACSAS